MRRERRMTQARRNGVVSEDLPEPDAQRVVLGNAAMCKASRIASILEFHHIDNVLTNSTALHTKQDGRSDLEWQIGLRVLNKIISWHDKLRHLNGNVS